MLKKIGFIGLGIMGKPMVKNLIKAGYKLFCYDINKDTVEELVKAGAEKGLNSADVTERSEIVITMLPNSPEVEEVILGKNGVLEGVKDGTIIVDMSSIDPIVSQDIAKKVAAKGAVMLDAPVSGGEPKAIEGTLSIMVGGPEKTFNEIKEVLLVMGKSAVWVGEIGSGNVTKLANQVIVALNIAAMSEALVLIMKAGVDPEKVYKAIKGGLAGSTVLDVKFPMILQGNFKPGFKIELHIKDIVNALKVAHEIGVPLPLTAQVMEIMQALKVDGLDKSDHSAIIQFYEKLADIKVRKKKYDGIL